MIPGFWILSEDEVSDLESDISERNKSSEIDEISDVCTEDESEKDNFKQNDGSNLKSKELRDEKESDNDLEVMDILENIESQKFNQNDKQSINDINNVKEDNKNIHTAIAIADNLTNGKNVNSTSESDELVCIFEEKS